MIGFERIPYNGPVYDKVVINTPHELREYLQKFCDELVNRLPAAYGVNLQPNGGRSFNCRIISGNLIDGFKTEQEFHIEWDLFNQVNWRPYYDN